MTKTMTKTMTETETKEELWARTAQAFALRIAREHRRAADRILGWEAETEELPAGSILARADAALAQADRGLTVQAYWLGGGWFVNDCRQAVVPVWVGDQHWKVWIPAEPSEDPGALYHPLRARLGGPCRCRRCSEVR